MRATADFFTLQERARRRSFVLVVLFIAAVVLTVLAVYVAVIVLVYYIASESAGSGPAPPLIVWQPYLFFYTAAATTLVILTGTITKVIALSGGGTAVAEMLGGRRLDPSTRDLDERRLYNVVEEMSLASGITVPAVYVLPGEKAINAFAAGFRPNEAAVAVTEGTLESLTREELQGVIAHEFSHILNGDMRMNIRLMGFLNGLLFISVIGRGIVRLVTNGRSRSRSSSNSKDGGNSIALAILVFGGALWAIGAIGLLFGKLIKASVSRQREFLADASAVQFTRNPQGIATALYRIMAGKGSQIENKHAEEASHLFFAEGVGGMLSSMLSTHPGLDDRIRAIDPGYSPASYADRIERSNREATAARQESASNASVTDAHPPAARAMPGMPTIPGVPAMPGGIPAVVLAGAMGAGGRGKQARFEPPADVARQVGRLTPEAIEHATMMLEAIPDVLREQVHDPLGARSVILATLFSGEPEARRAQLAALGSSKDSMLAQEVLAAETRVQPLGTAAFLPLLQLATPALRMLVPAQRDELIALARQFIGADQRVTTYEYLTLLSLRRLLEESEGLALSAGNAVWGIGGLVEEISVVLSAIARLQDEPERTFAAGAYVLHEPTKPISLREAQACGFDQIESSLRKLSKASPALKRRMIQSFATAAAFNGKVSIEEAELLRAIALALDCPLPPLVVRDVPPLG